MKLYLLQGCPFAHRATIALREKELAFEPVFFDPRARPAELEAAGPYAKSPTLFDGDVVVWDSLIVVDYLEDRYPTPALVPRDAAARAEVRMLASKVGAELGSRLGAIVGEVLKPAGKDEAKIAEATRGFAEALAGWDYRLAGLEFLLGGFSLADIVLYTVFPAMQRHAGFQVPAERANLRAWLARMAARPSTPLVEKEST